MKFISDTEYIERKVKEYERDVYGGDMPARNKATLRDELVREERFWAEWDVRKDSNRGRDDQ